MSKLLDLISLKPLQGERTQLTIIAAGIVNILVQLGILNLTPEQLNSVNQFLTLIGGYFFAEKVSKK